ncbi:MAG TPA: aminotransferase class I/II-fold pyridoxal phosphate-dependent enzyme [Chitinophagaceae bacterium]|nr:aminotransferase class I/II-fold pyridoxal phosphate-dependent enzyme [Chitinophagaceae bacterium]
MNEKLPLTGISSAAIHSGDRKFGESSHLPPIYATSTFTFDTADQGMKRFAGQEDGYIYTRWGNPTFAVAEETIAALEAFNIKDKIGAPLQLKAFLHASGQAAMTTMFLSNLSVGDTILSHFSLYGGTHEFLHKVLGQNGIKTIIADLRDLNVAEDVIKKNPSIKLVHIETPANPTIQCVDIDAVSKIAKQHGITVTVDNTFATPYLQQPFLYDVDFVFHSTTKFLNGHGTAIGGVLVGKDLDFMNGKAYKWYKLLGGNSNAFDAFLLINGMKTLEVRMERHCSNAIRVADFLAQHKAVAQVNYTGLTSHPDYNTCVKQMKHPGAMMSFELKGGLEAGKQFIDKLQMCVRAVSLGTVDTLISHPASMSHFGVAREQRLEYGITDGLIRMSVGMENVADILNDLEQALSGL